MNYNRVISLGGCIGGDTIHVPMIVNKVCEVYYLYTKMSRLGTIRKISYSHRGSGVYPAKLLVDLPVAQVERLGFTKYSRIREAAAYHPEDVQWAVFKKSNP